MKQKLIIIPLFLLLVACSEHCKCEDDFHFITKYIESNLPGFYDNVDDVNNEQYRAFKTSLKNQAVASCGDRFDCFKILTTYVEFFKDNHTRIIDENRIDLDEADEESLNKFFQTDLFLEWERIDLNDKLITVNPITQLENIYQTKDSVYTVSVVKSEKGLRSYAGVILESKTPLWENGQVKFELIKTSDNLYDMFLYNRDYTLRYIKRVELKSGILGNVWFNAELQNRNTYSTDVFSEMKFIEINDTINYIRIPSFSGQRGSALDSLYKKHDTNIQSKPYLIIDVRNNGGGSDENARPLLKYIYTKPFHYDNVEIYVTKENIRKWEEVYELIREDTLNFPKEIAFLIEDEVERMKQAPENTFITRTEGKLIRLDTILKYPKKIAIIANRNSVSSAETLLIWSKYSDKSILVGENSGGFVGYGEALEIKTPNFEFSLFCTMTRLEFNQQYEEVGVPPDYYLNNESDWLLQTIDILKKQ